VDDVREELERHHVVNLPSDVPFGSPERASFTFTRTMDIDDVVDWLGTNSELITAAPADREAGLARCRAALLERAGGGPWIEMPLRSWCWRADRLPRA
jgi:hypothetical protein